MFHKLRSMGTRLVVNWKFLHFFLVLFITRASPSIGIGEVLFRPSDTLEWDWWRLREKWRAWVFDDNGRKRENFTNEKDESNKLLLADEGSLLGMEQRTYEFHVKSAEFLDGTIAQQIEKVSEVEWNNVINQREQIASSWSPHLRRAFNRAALKLSAIFPIPTF